MKESNHLIVRKHRMLCDTHRIIFREVSKSRNTELRNRRNKLFRNSSTNNQIFQKFLHGFKMVFMWKYFIQHICITSRKSYFFNKRNSCRFQIFLLKFAYLCDIFEILNSLNISLQGSNKQIIKLKEKSGV